MDGAVASGVSEGGEQLAGSDQSLRRETDRRDLVPHDSNCQKLSRLAGSPAIVPPASASAIANSASDLPIQLIDLRKY